MTRRELIKNVGLALSATALPFPLAAFKNYDTMTDKKDFDVIIIGGSYAGLSAAMALGRSLRDVLIIDAGKPCNIQTPHSHNFLTQDGKTPNEISSLAKAQVEKYKTIHFFNGLAVSGMKTDKGFEITTETTQRFTAKKLVFASGIKDIMPEIPGLAECWGISVIHCPYCHGYENRKKNTAILANGARGFHLASLVNNLTDQLSILCNGPADFSEEQSEKLRKHKIEIIESPVAAIEHDKGQVKHLIFADGSRRSFDAVYAALAFTQNSSILQTLGCELSEQGYVKVSPFQESSVSGVFVCGDAASILRSVANAVYSGNLTGTVVNGKLVEESF